MQRRFLDIPPQRMSRPGAGRSLVSRALIQFCFAWTLLWVGVPSKFTPQDLNGGISGLVRSQAGVAIFGAKITLTDEKTSVSQSAATTRSGEYVFSSVNAGLYTLRVTSEGFEPAFRQHVAIDARQPTTLDFGLVPTAPSGSPATGPSDPLSSRAGYYDGTALKPSAVQGAVDAGGYSTPGQARATSSMIHGVAGMKNASGSSGVASAAGSGDPKAAAAMEAQLKHAVDRAPESFEAHHHLGEFYFHHGEPAAGVSHLEKAESLDPTHYDNGFDLAQALLAAGNPGKAREQLAQMIARQDRAELHDLLGEVEEAAGNGVAAVKEYQLAVNMDSSEGNIFDLGSELLLHQALDPAIEVLTRGVKLYPRSTMLLIGQGVGLYARGRYDDSVKALCTASDISPADPRPYVFLGKMYNVSTANTEEVTTRLERFVKLDPKNPQARFDYAMSVWKGQRAQGGQVNFARIEELLKSALAVDPDFADAHFELGNLYSEQKKYPEAIGEYRQALSVQPEMADAHYRLAQAYTRTGDPARAQQELELHDRLRRQQSADAEKKQNEIKQFVYSVKGEARQ